MKSIRTNPTVHALEGDERIRTAEQFVATDPAYVAALEQALSDIAATCDNVLERIAEVGEPPAYWSGTQLDPERVRARARAVLASPEART